MIKHEHCEACGGSESRRYCDCCGAALPSPREIGAIEARMTVRVPYRDAPGSMCIPTPKYSDETAQRHFCNHACLSRWASERGES